MEQETGVTKPQDPTPAHASGGEELEWMSDVLGSLNEPGDSKPDPGFITQISEHIRNAPERGTVLKPSRRLSYRTRFKVAALAAAGMLVLTAGLAFAGALPDAAQDKASQMLAKVGVSIPAGSAPENASDVDPASKGKGSEIRSTVEESEPGLERGSTVSDKASDGKSRAGENRPSEDAGAGGEGGPPPEPPGKANSKRP